jgi:hypothetical protein
MAFDKVMLSNLYLINGTSKCISKFYNNECVIICLYIYIDVVHETRLFLVYNFDMKDIVELMPYWTLKLLEIIIALFYLMHIMLKDALKI